MNIKEYIASGILEDYCFGMLNNEDARQVEQNALLFDEIKSELDANMLALEEYALSLERLPANGTKEKMITIIDNLNKEENLNIGALPLINRFSSHEKWLKIATPLLPIATNDNLYVKVLRDDGDIFQAVVWLKYFQPDEVHVTEQESALVLQGECICKIGHEETRFAAGDFFDIPLHINHNITVTNGPVLAILQRVKVA